MTEKISKLKNSIGGILLGFVCIIWLDIFISSGTIYSYVLAKAGMPDEIISFTFIGFVIAYGFGEIYLAIRGERVCTQEIQEIDT